MGRVWQKLGIRLPPSVKILHCFWGKPNTKFFQNRVLGYNDFENWLNMRKRLCKGILLFGIYQISPVHRTDRCLERTHRILLCMPSLKLHFYPFSSSTSSANGSICSWFLPRPITSIALSRTRSVFIAFVPSE